MGGHFLCFVLTCAWQWPYPTSREVDQGEVHESALDGLIAAVELAVGLLQHLHPHLRTNQDEGGAEPGRRKGRRHMGDDSGVGKGETVASVKPMRA